MDKLTRFLRLLIGLRFDIKISRTHISLANNFVTAFAYNDQGRRLYYKMFGPEPVVWADALHWYLWNQWGNRQRARPDILQYVGVVWRTEGYVLGATIYSKVPAGTLGMI